MKIVKEIAVLSVLAALSAAADTVDDDTGTWQFKFDDSVAATEATISKWHGSGTELSVPETLQKDGINYTVVALGMRSIDGGDTLEKVILPSTVTNLELNVFYNSANLTNLVFLGNKPNFGNHWFGDIDVSKLTVHVYIYKFGWADDLAAGVMTQTVTGLDGTETVAIPIKSLSDDATCTVSADPSPGLYYSSQQVSLSCDKTVPDGQRAIIYYTTDGTAPTLTSPRYAGPILVTTATTISCFAVLVSSDTGDFHANGPVASFTYKFPLPDGGPYTEKVNGSAWTFRVFGEKSYLCPPVHATHCIDPEPRGALTLPPELGGRPVAGVDVSAFERCRYLTEVVFPATVKTVGSFAFKDCLRLTNVVWQGSVPTIDLAAFDGCPLAGTGVTPTEPQVVKVAAEIIADDDGNVAVPESWLDDMAVLHGTEWKTTYIERFGSDFTNSLTKATGKTDAFGNALEVWQDYVAGTNPLDADDVFTAYISLTNDVPYISWSPDLRTATPPRVYKVYGMKTLGAKLSAVDVTELAPAERKAAGYRFYYVTVGL